MCGTCDGVDSGDVGAEARDLNGFGARFIAARRDGVSEYHLHLILHRSRSLYLFTEAL